MRRSNQRLKRWPVFFIIHTPDRYHRISPIVQVDVTDLQISMGDPLHNDSTGSTAAVANGRTSVLTRLQLMQQSHQDPTSGATQSMSQRNGSAPGVDIVGAQSQNLGIRLDHGGEGLVELPDGDVGLGQAGLLEHDGDDLGGGDGEVDGVERGVGERDDAGEDARGAAVGLGDILAAEDEGGGAVVERGAVGGGDGAGAVAHEGRLELLDLVELEAVVAFVLGDDRVALLALDRHGDDLVLEEAGRPGFLGALVGRDGELVLLLAGDFVLLGRVLGAVAHVDLVVHVPQAVGDQPVLQLLLAERRLLARAREVVRDAAHVLHAAGHDGLGAAQLDVLRRDRHGLEPARAHLVDGRGFDRGGQLGEHAGLSCGGLPHGALEDVAHVDGRDLVDGDG